MLRNTVSGLEFTSGGNRPRPTTNIQVSERNVNDGYRPRCLNIYLCSPPALLKLHNMRRLLFYRNQPAGRYHMAPRLQSCDDHPVSSVSKSIFSKYVLKVVWCSCSAVFILNDSSTYSKKLAVDDSSFIFVVNLCCMLDLSALKQGSDNSTDVRYVNFDDHWCQVSDEADSVAVSKLVSYLRLGVGRYTYRFEIVMCHRIVQSSRVPFAFNLEHPTSTNDPSHLPNPNDIQIRTALSSLFTKSGKVTQPLGYWNEVTEMNLEILFIPWQICLLKDIQ